jgi:hypothetical protein
MPTGEALAFPGAARDYLRSIGQVLKGGVTEVTSCQWRWFFDLRRGLFTRCSRTESPDRALQFGDWRQLQHVRVLDGDRLEVKEVARPAIRTSLHGATCGCSVPNPSGPGSPH